MILQALNDCYERLVQDEDSGIPEPGFSRENIHFCLVLDENGNLIGEPVDLRKEGRPKKMVVPMASKRAANVAANFLWDNTGYVLGEDDKGKPKNAIKKFQAFKDLHRKLGGHLDDEGMRAVLFFLEKWHPDDAKKLPMWDELAGLNAVFKLEGENRYVHERPALRKAWVASSATGSNSDFGTCLTTGEKNVPISRLHPKLKGVRGAQTAGASLVSFNLTAFLSLGKKQNFNAPVGEKAAFAYTTALNFLLRPGSRQKVQIGDATTVFWTENASKAESLVAGLFDPGILEGAPDSLRNDLNVFLTAVSRGAFPEELIADPDDRFYILGLSPNAARVSVRFWHVSTVRQISERIGRHFRDMAIVRNFATEPEHPPMWRILKSIAFQGDTRNISPLLAGQLARAVLTGGQYPRTLLSAAIGRIRADGAVPYLRAAVLKAYLIRNCNMEVDMSLNTDSDQIGYRLGRLFAILERVQEEAVPGANATIRDRFFGAASATPGRVFPVLMRGVQNNIAKLRKDPEKNKRSRFYDIQIAEIVDGIEQFPQSLSMDHQGLFAIGYYHQRKDLFTKKTDKDAKEA